MAVLDPLRTGGTTGYPIYFIKRGDLCICQLTVVTTTAHITYTTIAEGFPKPALSPNSD